MAKRRTRLFISVFACAMLLMCGALNCAYADDSSDDVNSWRFFHGELVLSDSGASTDNLGTFEEAAADSADGVMACSVETNGNGWPVYNWFDQFNRGYCSGVGAYKGVDVSEWQGKINWAQVKTAGVDFAILRCGYASTYPDKQWHNNVQGCLSSGMPFGVYLYSRATSPEEASKEADFVISQLKSEYLTGADLAFPVYFDMEDSKMVGRITLQSRRRFSTSSRRRAIPWERTQTFLGGTSTLRLPCSTSIRNGLPHIMRQLA